MIYNLVMKVAGIVVEFNPLHYGHEYIINKIKEDNADLIIAAMSPNFVMRGEPAIFNKFDRCKVALDKGIDIVSEIPTIYTIESADIYAYRGVEILNNLGITDLYFGVESTNEEMFYEIIDIMNNDDYKTSLSSLLKEGYSFNTASKKALENINPNFKEIIDSPNNTLALQYLISINKLNKNIKPHFIKRVESGYFDSINENKIIQSATALRELINKGKNEKYFSYSIENLETHVKENYFDLIKYRITSMSLEELKDIQGVSEGLENKLKSLKNINTYNDLILSLVSKRNRETKIKRILMCILLNIKKYEISNEPISYVRILGFNNKISSYFKNLNNGINIETFITSNQNDAIYRELDFTKIYDLKSSENLVLREYKPIIKY